MIKLKRKGLYKRLLLYYYKRFIIEQRIEPRGISKFFIIRKIPLANDRVVLGPYRSLRAAEADLKLLVRRVLSIKVHKRNARISRIKINGGLH